MVDLAAFSIRLRASTYTRACDFSIDRDHDSANCVHRRPAEENPGMKGRGGTMRPR